MEYNFNTNAVNLTISTIIYYRPNAEFNLSFFNLLSLTLYKFTIDNVREGNGNISSKQFSLLNEPVTTCEGPRISQSVFHASLSICDLRTLAGHSVALLRETHVVEEAEAAGEADGAHDEGGAEQHLVEGAALQVDRHAVRLLWGGRNFLGLSTGRQHTRRGFKCKCGGECGNIVRWAWERKRERVRAQKRCPCVSVNASEHGHGMVCACTQRKLRFSEQRARNTKS